MFLVSLPHTWPVQFSSSTERLAKFRWCIAKGRHLFPFRTEQLSLSAPMVLGGQPPGRVGRRRFFIEQTNSEPPLCGWLFVVLGCATPPVGCCAALKAGDARRRKGRPKPKGTRPSRPRPGQ